MAQSLLARPLNEIGTAEPSESRAKPLLALSLLFGRDMNGARLRVRLLIISRELDPARHLRRAFRRAGAHVLLSSYLDQAVEDAAEADVALLLADGYPLESALEVIARLPVQLILVVTARISDFRSCSEAHPEHARVHVMPSPAWSLTLVEAIRRGLPMSLGEA